TINPDLGTGEVEVVATEIEVLSQANELPVPVFGEPDYPEDLRLTYRFLDLRRETLHANIMKRLAVVASIRRRMSEAGFFEFATPILTASSPEGARDFLVPSRIHAGKFYALPQAPQQYKQLVMISGFDRYFQIAPCFRDEDPRADRLPAEFYQPDLRNPIEMADVTEHFRGSGFKIFAGMIEKDPKARVWAIPARGGGSRAFCDRMNKWAIEEHKQPGLGYIFWRNAGAAQQADPS